MAPEEVFAHIYDDYADAIFRHCLLRTYDRDLAKDLMQETFMKTWKYYASGEEVKNVKPLLYKIATNLMINESRRRKKRMESLDDLLEKGFEPGEDHREELNSQLDAQESAKYLSHLKEADRQLLMLRYLDDLSLKQIADILKVRENLVSVRLHRALKELEKIIRRFHS